MSSEVARLRQRIEEEITSMHFLMNGPAIVGRHEILARKHHYLTTYRNELETVVGEEQAGPLFFEIYTQAVEGDQHATTES